MKACRGCKIAAVPAGDGQLPLVRLGLAGGLSATLVRKGMRATENRRSDWDRADEDDVVREAGSSLASSLATLIFPSPPSRPAVVLLSLSVKP